MKEFYKDRITNNNKKTTHNKKTCVPKAVADEVSARKAKEQIDKHLG